MMRTVVCALLLVLFVSFVVGEDCTPSYNSSFVACRDLYPTTQACLEYVTCGNVGQETCGTNATCDAYGSSYCCAGGNPPIFVGGACQCYDLAAVAPVCTTRETNQYQCRTTLPSSQACEEYATCGNVNQGTCGGSGQSTVCSGFGNDYCCPGQTTPPIFVSGTCQCYGNATMITSTTTTTGTRTSTTTTGRSSATSVAVGVCGSVVATLAMLLL
eukprot:TRINITY_DN8016_c0_g1_i2.p1 TRINITY_DN8016_c0_g1~~TRINITY_DN8016_c0_g1_i2.p1  ORF type:complete len:215 (+),score=34.31 TRINITY_DN8016_c0_g1_i2:88-732(+)